MTYFLQFLIDEFIADIEKIYGLDDKQEKLVQSITSALNEEGESLDSNCAELFSLRVMVCSFGCEIEDASLQAVFKSLSDDVFPFKNLLEVTDESAKYKKVSSGIYELTVTVKTGLSKEIIKAWFSYYTSKNKVPRIKNEVESVSLSTIRHLLVE
jgi:hypothetical protein